MNAKQLKKHIEENYVGKDRVIARKNGTVVVRKTYFYRHGNSAESFATNVWHSVSEYADIESYRDVWRPWPKDSYFEVILAVK